MSSDFSDNFCRFCANHIDFWINRFNIGEFASISACGSGTRIDSRSVDKCLCDFIVQGSAEIGRNYLIDISSKKVKGCRIPAPPTIVGDV